MDSSAASYWTQPQNLQLEKGIWISFLKLTLSKTISLSSGFCVSVVEYKIYELHVFIRHHLKG